MIAALFKAFGQISDPAFRRVVVRSFIVSVAVFAVLVGAAAWALSGIRILGIGWLDSTLGALGGLGAFIVGLLLFPGIAITVVGLFLEDIVRAVEARHYPELPPGRTQPVLEITTTVLRFAGIAVALNLLVLPLYFVPALNLFVFYGLNGYLLGREYFELVALRRVAGREARALRRSRRWRVFSGGIVITFLMSIPVIGWMMPVIAAAFMVHLFEGRGLRTAGV